MTEDAPKHDRVFLLIYISRETRPMSGEELEALLAQSRENNASLGITGLLIHKAGHFFQILEGDREKVEALMARITKDERHDGVRTLVRDDGVRRRFGEWSMALADWPEENLEATRQWSALLEDFRTGRGQFGPSSRLVEFALSLLRAR